MNDENKKLDDQGQSDKNTDIQEITLDVIEHIFGETRHTSCGDYNL